MYVPCVQLRMPQSRPSKGRSHIQVPLMQSPWPLQFAGQLITSQPLPEKPAECLGCEVWHRHSAGFSGKGCEVINCPANCNGHGDCINGTCMCDLPFDGLDCGIRNCTHGTYNYAKGKCDCEDGWAGPACQHPACPGGCNGKGECLETGYCLCDEGFTGPGCEIELCPKGCSDHGKCINASCVCDDGFQGVGCELPKCPLDYSGHGKCQDGGICACEKGFGGLGCSGFSCPADCSGNGQCLNGSCICNTGFGGVACANKTCVNDCSGSGECIQGKCRCYKGWAGAGCEFKACPKNCSDHGACVNGTCSCSAGWAGRDCASKACPKNCSGHGACRDGVCACVRPYTGEACDDDNRRASAAMRCADRCLAKCRPIKAQGTKAYSTCYTDRHVQCTPEYMKEDASAVPSQADAETGSED